jgi:hypothetical protein
VTNEQRRKNVELKDIVVVKDHYWSNLSIKKINTAAGLIEFVFFLVFVFFFAVLGLELRAFTLSHSTSPFFL